jgi:hypothetical protein
MSFIRSKMVRMAFCFRKTLLEKTMQRNKGANSGQGLVYAARGDGPAGVRISSELGCVGTFHAAGHGTMR